MQLRRREVLARANVVEVDRVVLFLELRLRPCPDALPLDERRRPAGLLQMAGAPTGITIDPSKGAGVDVRACFVLASSLLARHNERKSAARQPVPHIEPS